MKKTILPILLFLQTSYTSIIETERTIWVPWTTEHTREWEIIEQQDSSISYFRRNDYFENMDDLITRDKNWLQLRAHIAATYNNTLFFPDLGFAILRKSDLMLIGIIRTKLSEKLGTLSFGYGLLPEVRNDKFGQEIIKTFTAYIDQLLATPMIALRIDKNAFMATWHTEGIKKHPNFEYLASFFDTQSHPLKKVTGSVDAQNPASLTVLMRNSMQPFALDCDKYICANGEHYFSYDFLLQYPAEAEHPCEHIEQLARELLSRDNLRIQNTYLYLTHLFHVDNDWDYKLFSRAEKQALQLLEKNSLRHDCTATKNIISRTYYPPYCFIK